MDLPSDPERFLSKHNPDEVRELVSDIADYFVSRVVNFVSFTDGKPAWGTGTPFFLNGKRYVLTVMHCAPKECSIQFITGDPKPLNPASHHVSSIYRSEREDDDDGLAILELTDEADLPTKSFDPLPVRKVAFDRIAIWIGYPFEEFDYSVQNLILTQGVLSTARCVPPGEVPRETSPFTEPVFDEQCEFGMEYRKGREVDEIRNYTWGEVTLPPIKGVSGGGVWQCHDDQWILVGVVCQQDFHWIRAIDSISVAGWSPE